MRSVKEEFLSRVVLLGEDALRQVHNEYDTHYNHEGHHQGKGNKLLMPGARKEGWDSNPIRACERLGRLLKYYHREAA